MRINKILYIIFLINIFLNGLNGKEVIIKENGNFKERLNLNNGEIVKLKPTYNIIRSKPPFILGEFEYFYFYSGEDEIDFQCIENRLFINKNLRGLVINKEEDLKEINKDINLLVFNIEITNKIINNTDLSGVLYLKFKEKVENLEIIKNMSKLKYLDLSRYYYLQDDELKIIQSLSNLEYLDMNHNKITNIGIEYLKVFKKLKYLDLTGNSINNEALKSIGMIANLEYLNLSECNISGEGLKYIISLKKLKHLNLKDTKISNIGLKYISGLSCLEELNIMWCHNINDNGMQNLSDCTKLKSLLIDYIDITDNGISYLSNLINMENLIISRINLTDKGLEYIRNFKKLKSLDISQAKIAVIENLLFLKEFKDMEALNLSYIKIGDAGMKIINSLTGLKSLVLENCNISDKGLESISNLNLLEELDLNINNISDSGLQYLRNLKNIKILSVTDNKNINAFEHLMGVSEYAKRYYVDEKILSDRIGICNKNDVQVKNGKGLSYQTVDVINKGDEVTLLNFESLNDNINGILTGSYYDEVNDVFFREGTQVVIIEKKDTGYLIAAEKGGRKYLVLLDNYYFNNYNYINYESYYYNIKTKKGVTGWVQCNHLKTRDRIASGETLYEARLNHILVDNEELAEKIASKIQSGENIEKLAKEYSLCPGRENGGYLGWVNEIQFELLKNLYFLPLKTFGTIYLIKTKFGYHAVIVTGIIYKNEGYRFIFSY